MTFELLREPGPRPSLAVRDAPGHQPVLELTIPIRREPRRSDHTEPSSSEFHSARTDFGIDMLVVHLDSMVDGVHRSPSLDASQVVAALPVPRLDSRDPSCALLANLQHTHARHALKMLQRVTFREGANPSALGSFEFEASLQLIRVLLELGETRTARATLESLRPQCVGDWRIAWYTAIAALLDTEYRRAHRQFDIVRAMLPDESAPSLAMAATAELLVRSRGPHADGDDWQQASIENYRRAWQTDRRAASAVFGLARRLAEGGAIPAAVAVLDELPTASPHRVTAGLAGCLLQVSIPSHRLTENDLRSAAGRLADLTSTPRCLPTRVVLLWATLAWLLAGGQVRDPKKTILGTPATESGLRSGLEAGLRALARTADDTDHRIRLVDSANRVRPRTWL